MSGAAEAAPGDAMRGPGFRVRLAPPAPIAVTAAGAIGAIGFAGAARPAGLDPRVPFLSLPLPLAGPDGPDAAPPVELWSGDGAPFFEDSDAVASARTADALFGVVDEAGFPAAIRAGGIEAVAREAYARVLARLARHPGLRLVRVHNYLPRILAVEDGRERYRAFNTGRLDAFERHRRATGTADGPADAPAAATAIEVPDDRFRLSFLASRAPAAAIENPRQVSAWAYPRRYGPTSPTFSRAMLVGPSPEAADAPVLLLVSGTASIVGHESLHAGDAAAQADEIRRNLDAVVARAEAASAGVAGAVRLRFYLARDADPAPVLAALHGWRGAGPSLALRTTLCRPDLAVEVEAMVELARA